MQQRYRCRIVPIVRLWDSFDHNLRADLESAKLTCVIGSGVGLPRCASVEVQRGSRLLMNLLLPDWTLILIFAKPPHADEPYAEA